MAINTAPDAIQNKLLRIYKLTNHTVQQDRFPSLARQDFRDCEGSESHMLVTFGELRQKTALSYKFMRETNMEESMAEGYTLSPCIKRDPL